MNGLLCLVAFITTKETNKDERDVTNTRGS
jgi:hypothetical protein